MKAYYQIRCRRLDGYRAPEVLFDPAGRPIIPIKGDTVVMNGVALLVEDVIWYVNHPGGQEDSIKVLLTEGDAIEIAVPEKSKADVYDNLEEILMRGLDIAPLQAGDIIRTLVDSGVKIYKMEL